MRIFIITLFCLTSYFNAFSQTEKKTIFDFENELENLGHIITNDTTESKRITANYEFIKTLVSALKEKNSFYHTFQKLNPYISIKTSDDKKFRIFSWFVLQENGSFRYYGTIQVNNSNKLELIPLIDNTLNIDKNIENVTLANNEWLGAVYYDIITIPGKEPFYTLLGWKGNNFESTSKIIETLSIKNGVATFGLPVLQKEAKSNQYLNRKIFTYKSEGSMLLKYNKNEKQLVFDHLIPQDDKADDAVKIYIPDLSYDAYKLRGVKWQFLEDIKLQNAPNQNDDLLVDPSKVEAGTTPIRKY